jgi:uncharacterized protein (TIGR02145 family)
MKTKQTNDVRPFSPFGGRGAVLLLFLWGAGGLSGDVALAQSTVTITPMGANYGEKTVTFLVKWSGAAYNDHVWVWVDYCPVEGATPAATYSPASIGAMTITAADGSVTTSSGNTRGFFVTTNNATVTATLSNATGQFNWCAYGSGDPPSAAMNAAGGYTLKGTPPFTINGTLTENMNTFGAGTCITSITDLTGNPEGIVPDKPAVGTTSPATLCSDDKVTLTASASGGTTTSNTYTWKVGSAIETHTTVSTYSPSVIAGSTTYSVKVTNANGCTSAAATGTITVHPVFSAGSIITANDATTTGTAPLSNPANATEASGGYGNITYEWRRTGTSEKTLAGSTSGYTLSSDPTNYSTSGTYYFTRWAHEATCNTSFVQSEGQYTLTVSLYPPGAGTQTWTCDHRTWSGAISYDVYGCTGTADFGNSNPPGAAYYRSSGLYAGSGYLYNWKCVHEKSATLCPSPWRVPAKDDFIALDQCLGGSGSNRTGVSQSWITENYIDRWGGLFGGMGYRNAIYDGGSCAYYWSSTYSGTYADDLYFCADGKVGPRDYHGQYYGMQLRCVREE